MRIAIDSFSGTIETEAGPVPLYSPRGFEIVSDLWLKVGWDQRYPYGFSWMGQPVLQLPEDLIRAQEQIWRLAPDVIVETGVAHGGSLLFWASVGKAASRRCQVIGIEKGLLESTREAIARGPLSDAITLIAGDSTDADVVAEVKALIHPWNRVMVFLDSCHAKDHVRAELETYAPLVTLGSYIVACDGIMAQVAYAPRGTPAWRFDNPKEAAREFAAAHPEFVIEQPPRPHDDSRLPANVTHHPGGWLRRVA